MLADMIHAIKNSLISLALALVAFVILYGDLVFPHKGSLGEREYKNLIAKACKNDTKALKKFENYYLYYASNEVLLINFFKEFSYLKNPFVDYLLGVHIKNKTFKHKDYLGIAEIEKNFKEALFFLRRSKDYEKTKKYMAKYKNLADKQIIDIWKKELKR